MNDLYQWYQVSQQLTQLKEWELTLRKDVFAQYFPEPKEGTNKTEIEGNAVLVAVLPYNYSIDADNLAKGLKHIPAGSRDKIIKTKPELVKSVYNALSKKAKASFSAECLSITPGTPQLSIKPSKDDE